MRSYKELRRFIALIFTALYFAAIPAAAQSTKTISMRDGSTIQGTILSMQNGEYVVDSPSLGKVHIKEANVLSITASDAPLPPKTLNNPSDRSAQISDLMNGIMGDPELMNDIQELAKDPELEAIIMDPSFLNAVQTQDFRAIETSSATRKLMNNPKMKALVQKIMAQQLKK